MQPSAYMSRAFFLLISNYFLHLLRLFPGEALTGLLTKPEVHYGKLCLLLAWSTFLHERHINISTSLLHCFLMRNTLDATELVFHSKKLLTFVFSKMGGKLSTGQFLLGKRF